MKAKIINIANADIYQNCFSRKLKIYKKYFSRCNHRFIVLPEIRLSGRWLSDMGFKSGEDLLVQNENDRIIIMRTEKR